MKSAGGDRMWGEQPGRDSEAIPAARLGADLRAARERLGWTLPAIAAHLRIRLPFLEAIEQGRTDDLPGNAYAVGFIRTYAQALGLDVDEVARRFRAEAGEVSRRTELDFPAPVPERGVPMLAVVLVATVLVVGAYAGWYRLSGSRHPDADAVQTVPARLVPLVADKPPPPPAIVPPPPSQAMTTPPAAMPPATMPPATMQVPPAPQMASAMPLAAPNDASRPAISPSSAAAATAEPAMSLPPSDSPPGVMLRATADAWMQVREKGGPVLLNRVLRAGETWQVPSGHGGLLLTTGNAGGTEMVVDGVASAPLGGDGAVRRDLPLDSAAMKDGTLAAASPVRRIVLPHNQ